MGYCIDVFNIDFKIKKENVNAVIEKLKDYAQKHKNISWVNNNTIIEADNIEDIFKEIRYSLFVNEEGDYEIEYFNGEKLGDDFNIFSCVAEFVEDGFIEYRGEDGSQWRYVFKDGEMTEKYGRIVWDD